MKNYNHAGNHSNRMWGGLILLIMGVVFFLRNFGIEFPDGVFGWYTFLIVAGLIVGARRNFNGRGWLIMVLSGGYFMLQAVTDVNLSGYGLAVFFVASGLFLVLKPKGWNKFGVEKEKPDFGSAEHPDRNGTMRHDYINIR